MANEFFVKCPNCNHENQVNSDYWELDMGANMRCVSCGEKFYCNHPESIWKKTGEAVAYEKS